MRWQGGQGGRPAAPHLAIDGEHTVVQRHVGVLGARRAGNEREDLVVRVELHAQADTRCARDDRGDVHALIGRVAASRAVATSAEKYAPHILCDHIYRVAQAFSRFYTDCPILVDDTPDDVRASRLALAGLTLRQLEKGLNILGIEAPERM